VSAVLAIGLPLLIVAASLLAMERFRDTSDEREQRNAGRVMNGKVLEGGVVQTIERRLAATSPDVIILGNSLSNTDLNPALLAHRLGIPKHKVQKFSIPNSIGAHWYTILKNRVYANGHTPRVIIALSDLQSALAVNPRSEPAYVNLTVHYSDHEPAVDRKLGTSNFYWRRVRENREKVRELALKGARNFAVDLLYWNSFAVDHARTTAALERAFDASRTDMRLHNNVIPTFEGQRDLVPFDPSELPKPKDSFFPETTTMVAENEGMILYIRPPMSPLLPDGLGDVVVKGTEARVTRMVENRGGRYLDLRGLEMTAGHFHNVDHMNPEGARRFTEVVAVLVRQIEAEHELRPNWKRRAPPVELELFNPFSLAANKLEHMPSGAEYTREPPDVPGSGRPYNQARTRKPVAYFAADGLAFLSDPKTIEETRFAARCSPLRVLEDGTILEQSNVPCEELFKHPEGGRVCHMRDRLFFTSSDGSDPFQNDREYRIGLDPERTCEGGTWLYGHDQVRLRFTEDELVRLQRGGRTLRVEAVDFGNGKDNRSARVAVKLRVNGQLRVDDSFQPSKNKNGVAAFRISPHVNASARDVVVSIANQSDNFVLITSSVLSERAAEQMVER
jgi:hypothetical protein